MVTIFEMSRQVLIYGDSHVARLKVAIDDIDTPLLTDFGVDQAMGQIEFIGRRGGHIAQVDEYLALSAILVFNMGTIIAHNLPFSTNRRL